MRGNESSCRRSPSSSPTQNGWQVKCDEEHRIIRDLSKRYREPSRGAMTAGAYD